MHATPKAVPLDFESPDLDFFGMLNHMPIPPKRNSLPGNTPLPPRGFTGFQPGLVPGQPGLGKPLQLDDLLLELDQALPTTSIVPTGHLGMAPGVDKIQKQLDLSNPFWGFAGKFLSLRCFLSEKTLQGWLRYLVNSHDFY